MSILKDKLYSTSGIQKIYTDLHILQIKSKLSHFKTLSFAKHSAFGLAYDRLNELIDELVEQLIGYSNEYPTSFNMGTIEACSTPEALGNEIIMLAKLIIEFSCNSKYENIENLGQELSGIGAKLKFLSKYA